MSIRIGYVLKMFPRLSETFVLNELLELEAQGVEVEIFSLMPPTEPRFHAELSRLRAEITYLPRANLAEVWEATRGLYRADPIDERRFGAAFAHALAAADRDSLRTLLHGALIARMAEERCVDHLHAHFATSATRAALLAHLCSGISFSFTAHAKDIYHQSADGALLAEALQRAAFAVTVTDQNLRHLRTLGSGTDQLRRIYNGVRLDSLSEIRSVAAARPHRKVPRLISVGRLVEKKGFLYLIEACALLKAQGLPFQCQIIGRGEGEAVLRAAIDRLEVGDVVELLGSQPHDRVLEAVADSDLMILPCIIGQDGNRDALPTVLLEAMALRVAVVSTDLEGVTEIVDHEVTGLLVPQKDGASLAVAMRRFIVDVALRDRCAEAGQRKAERLFNIQHNVGQLADLFALAAEQRRQGMNRALASLSVVAATGESD